MSPLIADPISAAETEHRCTVLLKEFWKSYFDGASHDVGNGWAEFPECEIGFNQVTPEYKKPVIHTVYATLRPERQFDQTPGAAGKVLRVQVNTVLNIFVRVGNAGQARVGGEAQCRRIADQIKQVLESPTERERVGAKGILRPRLLSGPLPQPFPGQQVRLLIVSAQLVYRI